MTQRASTYLIGDRTFEVMFGDLPNHRADALVSSDDNYLTMGGGVSQALAVVGGRQIAADAQKHVPLKLGDVAVTTAGSLPAKYIFHGITIDLDTMTYPDAACLDAIVMRCLTLAEALGLRHVAFPALGTGTAGFPFEQAAQTMTKRVADFLSRDARHLDHVTLVLFAPSGRAAARTDLFYERAVGLAAQWTDSRRLGLLLDELEGLLGRTDSDELRARAHRLREEVRHTEESLATTAGTGAPEPQDATDPLSAASAAIEVVADDSAAEIDQEDLEARETVLKLRLQSLRTQHNVLIGNLNRLEERRAKYGPHAVPLEVENGIADVTDEITAKERDIRAIKSDLARLHPPAGGGGR
jgi:O-acetyl-ADP-ribose deacetylase (regulator of RNase III)